MNDARQRMDPGSRRQLWALIAITVAVMVLGILVVAAPDRFGVPRPVASPMATPATPPTG